MVNTDKKIKLILGLGNRDAKGAKKIALLYARAGVKIFDMSPLVLPFVQDEFVRHGLNLNDFIFCVSINTIGDVHGKKAIIGPSCVNCGLCRTVCPQNAMGDTVQYQKCIGCGLCAKVCKYNAITYKDIKTGFEELENVLNNKSIKVDMVELHISSPNKKNIESDFNKLTDIFKGKISICLSRKYFSTSEAIALLNKLQAKVGRDNFYVQADGNSMNGAKSDIVSTIECVAFALALAPQGYKITVSGGTNLNTPKLLKECSLKCGIGYGTYARKIILNSSSDDDAFKKASEFVKTVSGL